MRALADDAFERRLTAHVFRHFGPKQELNSYGKIRLAVRRGIAKARSYGLLSESTVAAFVFLLFAVGQNFDAHPLAHLILTDTGIPPNMRIDGLVSAMTPNDWEAAATYRVR
jgi:hypothetical protein